MEQVVIKRTQPFVVNTKVLGRCTVVGYRQWLSSNSFEPIVRITVQQVLQPEYGHIRGEVIDYYRREFFEFYVLDTLYNVWRSIELTQE